MRKALVISLLILMASSLPRGPLSARSGASFVGVQARSQSDAKTGRLLLRQDVETLRRVRTRGATYLMVAESVEDWERRVAPGLEAALSFQPPEVFGEFFNYLPDSVRTAGPDIEGALLRFDLPDERGRGFFAFHLPLVMKSGRADPTLLNSKRPNVGLFVSGADVRRVRDGEGEDVRGIYLPGLPRSLVGGMAPSVQPRELPRGGRGELVIFRGRGGSGDDADELRRDYRRFLGEDEINGASLRPFPAKGSLGQLFRTVRVESRALDREDGWYASLSRDPSSWRFDDVYVRHPTRHVAFSVPIAVDYRSGDRWETRSMVAAVVAFYAPVLLDPAEAALYLGVEPKRLFTAIHDGELPFFRDGEDILLYRGHLERWKAGRALRGGGKARSFREALRRIESLAERHRSRAIQKSREGPIPFRFVPIPADEMEAMVDPRRRTRGRVFSEDLTSWLSRQEQELDSSLSPVALFPRERAAAAELAARFSLRSAPAVLADASARRPREGVSLGAGGRIDLDDEDDQEIDLDALDDEEDGALASAEIERGEGGLAKAPSQRTLRKAPSSRTVDRSGARGGALVDWDDGLSSSEPRGWEDGGGTDETARRRSDYGGARGVGFGAVEVAGESSGDAAGGPLRIGAFYVTSPSCRAGRGVEMVLDFVLDDGGGDKAVDLLVSWEVVSGGRAVASDSWDFQRKPGEHEIELDMTCPEAEGPAQIHLTLSAASLDAEVASDTTLKVKAASGRSWAELVKPTPKRCLVFGGDTGSDDFGVASSDGLSPEQIGQAVRAFQEQTLRCHGGEAVSGTVTLQISVDCSGVVSEVVIEDEDIYDAEFTECVADVMSYAPFPAHDRQGGSVFTMPLRYD